MKRSRLSITGLMGLILVVAVAISALHGGSVFCASAAFTVALISCLGALPGAISRGGRARMAWGSYALFAGTYLALAFGPFHIPNGVTPPPFPTLALYEPFIEAQAPRAFNYGGRSFESAVVLDPAPNGERFFFALAPIFVPDGRPPTNAVGGSNTPHDLPQGVEARNWAGSAGGATLAQDGTGVIPPGLALVPARLMDRMQVRRILHSLGAIAFGLIGAGVGWAVTPRPSRGLPEGPR